MQLNTESYVMAFLSAVACVITIESPSFSLKEAIGLRVLLIELRD